MVQSGPETGKVFSVERTSLVVGRQVGTDIVINDQQISRRHARFDLVNGTLIVNDLGSANGTKVNGQRLEANQSRPLAPGDTVQMGTTVLVVRGSTPANPPLPAYPSYNQPPAAVPPPVAPPAIPYNQTYQAQPLASPVNNAYPPANYQQPAYPAQAPAPAYRAVAQATPARKSNTGLLIGGVIGIVAIAALAIGAIVVLFGSGTSTQTPSVFNPPSAAPGSVPTPAAAPVPTAPVGASGTNPPPPQPPGSDPPDQRSANLLPDTGSLNFISTAGGAFFYLSYLDDPQQQLTF